MQTVGGWSHLHRLAASVPASSASPNHRPRHNTTSLAFQLNVQVQWLPNSVSTPCSHFMCIWLQYWWIVVVECKMYNHFYFGFPSFDLVHLQQLPQFD
jgi:hypothetical protein